MLFGENVHHILANKDVNQNTAEPMQATLRQCILLNKIHSRIFAIPPVSLSTETRTDNSEKMILNCLSKIQLIPAEKFSFDYSSCINETKIHEEVEIIMNDISNSKFAHYVNCMKNAEKKNKNNNKENPTITFLGTGSAQPSKYRNVTMAYRSNLSTSYQMPTHGAELQLHYHLHFLRLILLKIFLDTVD